MFLSKTNGENIITTAVSN